MRRSVTDPENRSEGFGRASPTPYFLSDLVRAVARLAPPELAEPWDNVGLQVGHPTAPVRRVMTCLKLTESTLEEAIAREAGPSFRIIR
jgi:hypothetical protein